MATGSPPPNDSGGTDKPVGNNKVGKIRGRSSSRVIIDEITDLHIDEDDVTVTDDALGEMIRTDPLQARREYEQQQMASPAGSRSFRPRSYSNARGAMVRLPALVPNGHPAEQFVGSKVTRWEYDDDALVGIGSGQCSEADAEGLHTSIHGPASSTVEVRWSRKVGRAVACWVREEREYTFNWLTWQGNDELRFLNPQGGPAHSINNTAKVTLFGDELHIVNIKQTSFSRISLDMRLVGGVGKTMWDFFNSPQARGRRWSVKFLDESFADFYATNATFEQTVNGEGVMTITFEGSIEYPQQPRGTMPMVPIRAIPSVAPREPTSDGGDAPVVPKEGWGDLPKTGKRRKPKRDRGR